PVKRAHYHFCSAACVARLPRSETEYYALIARTYSHSSLERDHYFARQPECYPVRRTQDRPACKVVRRDPAYGHRHDPHSEFYSHSRFAPGGRGNFYCQSYRLGHDACYAGADRQAPLRVFDFKARHAKADALWAHECPGLSQFHDGAGDRPADRAGVSWACDPWGLSGKLSDGDYHDGLCELVRIRLAAVLPAPGSYGRCACAPDFFAGLYLFHGRGVRWIFTPGDLPS